MHELQSIRNVKTTRETETSYEQENGKEILLDEVKKPTAWSSPPSSTTQRNSSPKATALRTWRSTLGVIQSWATLSISCSQQWPSGFNHFCSARCVWFVKSMPVSKVSMRGFKSGGVGCLPIQRPIFNATPNSIFLSCAARGSDFFVRPGRRGSSVLGVVRQVRSWKQCYGAPSTLAKQCSQKSVL